MERTKNVDAVNTDTPQEERIRWQKVGGGSLRLENPARIIKPNEIFKAYPSEIPKKFRDVIIPLEPIGYEAPVGAKSAPKKPADIVPPLSKPAVNLKYTLAPRGKSKYLFDVVGPDGKIVNEQPLKKEVAEQFLKDLEG